MESNDAWHADALKGKMFGVLVALDGDGRCGYLAAFSGLLDGRNEHDFFVPPVFDFLSPTGYFKCEEREISEINNTVAAVKAGDEYKVACEALARMDAEREHTLATEREAMRMAKEGREQRRASGGLSPEEEQALRRLAAEVIPQRVAVWGRQMGLTPTGVKITSAKKRFGSCSGRNSLCFSWRLMQYPAEAVDYVVVHELAHIRHHNHGAAFWALVEHTLPDYRARQALLRD